MIYLQYETMILLISSYISEFAGVYHLSLHLSKFVLFVCLFDLILYVPSTIFQLNRDGSSWVEPGYYVS